MATVATVVLSKQAHRKERRKGGKEKERRKEIVYVSECNFELMAELLVMRAKIQKNLIRHYFHEVLLNQKLSVTVWEAFGFVCCVNRLAFHRDHRGLMNLDFM